MKRKPEPSEVRMKVICGEMTTQDVPEGIVLYVPNRIYNRISPYVLDRILERIYGRDTLKKTPVIRKIWRDSTSMQLPDNIEALRKLVWQLQPSPARPSFGAALRTAPRYP